MPVTHDDRIQSQNMTGSTTFAYDLASSTLSGQIASSNVGQRLQSLPLVITDTQNISLNTLLVLTPVPSLFTLPASTDSSANMGEPRLAPGEVALPQNFSSPVSFDLSKYMVADGPSRIKSGIVKLTALIKPDAAKNWLSFDGTTLVLKGMAPTSGEQGLVITTGSPSAAKATGDVNVMHERRKHHLQSQTNQVFAAASTSEYPSQHSTSSSVPIGSPSPLPPLQLVSSSANTSIVNITFAAHSLDSRTISTMRLILQLGANMTCTTVSCSSSTSSDDNGDAGHAARIGLILALVFGSLLLLAFVVACYRMRRNRTESTKGIKSTDLSKDQSYALHRDAESADTVMSPNAAWARNSVAYDGADLEKGAGEKGPPTHSIAETRGVAATMPRDGEGESRVTTPTAAYDAHAIVEGATPGGQEDPGAISETSGSHYEDGTSVGTSNRTRPRGGEGSTSGSGTDKEAVTSGESDVDGKCFPEPSTRPIEQGGTEHSFLPRWASCSST
jgi:Protein of unknown function (DUF1180)